MNWQSGGAVPGLPGLGIQCDTRQSWNTGISLPGLRTWKNLKKCFSIKLPIYFPTPVGGCYVIPTVYDTLANVRGTRKTSHRACAGAGFERAGRGLIMALPKSMKSHQKGCANAAIPREERGRIR